MKLEYKSHGGSAEARQARTIKVTGWIPTPVKSRHHWKTNFSCAYYDRELGGSEPTWNCSTSSWGGSVTNYL